MRIALIADTFPPLRSSGAVQLRDLAREFVQQGHDLSVLLPAPDQSEAWRLDSVDGATILRLKAPRTKDIGYARRTLAEFLMPFFMRRNLAKSPLASARWDAVVWYSPSIFHGPLVRVIKAASGCKSYLIIRDIFPEWAVDMGLMGRGLPYRLLAAVARYQYAMADVIGVQTHGNLAYFGKWQQEPGRQVQVLQNWLGAPAQKPSSIRLEQTPLAGRRIFVYAGNMGVAQGMSVLLDLAAAMQSRRDIGFLFVGRGSEAGRLKSAALARQLDNVLFHDEIDPDEIADLYAQCAAGIVALDPRHKSHNIPGKFLTYMQCGLPVLASINPGNDLAQVIQAENIGKACETHQPADLALAAGQLLDQMATDHGLSARCKALFQREYAAAKAVAQIVAAVSPPATGAR